MKKNKNRHRHLIRTSVVMILLAALFAAGIWFGFRRYRQGILDVCAEEQDGYVKLVLDQINLNADRSDDEIISDILETLDPSDGKYWTFSQDQNFLFVRNVMETDKYKNVSADTYYDSHSAERFFHHLKQNDVEHAEIEIGDDRYLASGASFAYGEKTYSLVLLSSEDVFLDNNSFLGAETSLLVLMGAALILLVIVPMVQAWKEDDLAGRQTESERENVKLRQSLMKEGDRSLARQLYTDEGSVWDLSLLSESIARLKAKGAESAAAVRFRFENEEEKNDFLRNGNRMISGRYLLFGHGNELVLLFANTGKDQVKTALKPVKDQVQEIRMYDWKEDA